MINVFVYGTLMFPEVAGPIARIVSVGEPLTVRGFRRFEARTREWGNYPVIRRDEFSSVDGILFRELGEKQLAQLDRYEDVAGGLYVRSQIQVNHKGEDVYVDLYECGPALSGRLLEPLSKPWDPELFQTNELDRYIKEIVIPFVQHESFTARFEN